MISIDIYRGSIRIVTVKPEENSVQAKTIMGENVVRLNFKMNYCVGLKIGDYFTVFNETYTINREPQVQKIGAALFDYAVVADAEGYGLVKAQYLFLDSANQLTKSDFTLTGQADTFLQLMIDNAERVVTGWAKGQMAGATGTRTISFSKDNCQSALEKIANAFGSEWWVQGKTIHLAKRYRDTGFVFRHGKNKGLYTITRQQLDSSSVITRLYVYGGDKNIPADYANFSKRLRLPAVADPKLVTNVTVQVTDNGDGTQKMTFNWTTPSDPGATTITINYQKTGLGGGYTGNSGPLNSPRSITVPSGSYNVYFTTHGSFADASTGVIMISGSVTVPLLVGRPESYIESSAVGTYGVIEATEILDDIYPHRTGRVTSIVAGDPFRFFDQGIDFDVNGQLLPGLSPRVNFTTGQLAGYSFKIKSFDPVTSGFVFLKNEDEKTFDVPSSYFKPAIGDQYVITDIRMPASYVADAEKELLAKARAKLSEYDTPKATYRIEIDPVFLKKKNWKINLGELVWIVDEDLAIQRKIRVVQVTRNLVEEYSYSITISDIVTPGTVTSLQQAQGGTAAGLNALSQQVNNNSILNNNVVGDLNMTGESTVKFENIPTTSTTANHSPLYIDNATGKIVRKV